MPLTPEEWADFEKAIKYRDSLRHASTNLWNDTPNAIAMPGEVAMCDLYGGKPNAERQPGGDRGIDIDPLYRWPDENGKLIEEWITNDVKTARIPKCLLVGAAGQQSPVKPRTIYILARYLSAREAELLGWEWGYNMMKCPTQDWEGNGKIVHYKPRYLLRPISDLKLYYAGFWRHPGHSRYSTPQPADYGKPAAPVVNTFTGKCRLCDAPGLYVNTRLRLPEGGFVWECERHRSV